MNDNVLDNNLSVLKSMLRKFKKDQLINSVFRMPCFGIDATEADARLSKDRLVDGLAKAVKDSDLEDVLARLRLVYIQTHSNTRMWNVAEVKNMSARRIDFQGPLSFEECLQHFLNKSHFSCKVTCQLHEQCFWTEIKFGLMEKLTRRSKNSPVLTYLLYYPHTPFFLYCGLRATHHKILERALLQTLQGTKIKDLALNGRCIASLLQLALQREGQDFSTGSGVPSIIKKQLKKRTVEEPEQIYNLINEDQERKIAQENYVSETFGQYELPHLEVITYKTSVGFYGFDDDDDKREDAVCRVKFKGQSVLEGFRELVHHGFTCMPVPSYVASVPYLGINKINIIEERRPVNGEH